MTKKNKSSEKILEAAYTCLSNNGYANVSMRDIAKQSEVALSQLTYHYGTKENLFLEVIDMMMEKYLSEVETKISLAKGSKEKLGALINFFKDLIKKDKKLLRLLVDLTAQAMWVPSFKDKMDSMFKRISFMIESQITDDLQLGKQSSTSASKFIFGALFGTSVQILMDSETEKEYEPLNLTQSLLT